MRTTIALASALAATAAAPVCLAQAQPRYLTQIQAELQAMGLAPQCAATNAQVGACRVRATGAASSAGDAGAAGARRFLLVLHYDDTTDTIYTYVDHYAALRADAPNAAQAFRRLMELNWQMLVGKFEWSSATGEVRLSAVMNTDSNFDRRAFRGVVRAVLRLAERNADEVARVTGSPVGLAAEAGAGAGGAAGDAGAADAAGAARDAGAR